MAKIIGIETFKNLRQKIDKINPLRYRVGITAGPYLDTKAPFPLDLKLRLVLI